MNDIQCLLGRKGVSQVRMKCIDASNRVCLKSDLTIGSKWVNLFQVPPLSDDYNLSGWNLRWFTAVDTTAATIKVLLTMNMVHLRRYLWPITSYDIASWQRRQSNRGRWHARQPLLSQGWSVVRHKQSTSPHAIQPTWPLLSPTW